MRWRLLALSRNSRTILRRKIAIEPESQSGQIMGEFLNQKSPVNHSCDARSTRSDPLFFLEHFLSGIDSGRDRLIRADNGLN